jgi:hypothetical protein
VVHIRANSRHGTTLAGFIDLDAHVKVSSARTIVTPMPAI